LVLRISPAEFLSSLVDPQVAEAIQVSLTTTAITLAVTLLGGTPVAYLLARRRFRGHTVLDTLLDLPMVLPPAVAGIALLVTFGRFGLLASVNGWLLSCLHLACQAGSAPVVPPGMDLAFTQIAVVLAQTFVAAPFYVKTAASAFAAVDRDLEQAAAVDGAAPLTVFRSITAPLCAPALVGGAVMTWARALGEFGATILFAGNFQGRTQTMPLAIYLGFELDLRISLTLSIILLAVSFGILFIVKGVLRQRLAVATSEERV
jgi:molybdate transport system permease protein